MRDIKTVRAFALGFACGAGAALVIAFFPSYLVDKFYERQIESKAIGVWERQAVGASYEECRDKPASCLGRIVEWPVTHLSDGQSFWGGNQSYLIRWRNPQQLPRVPGPNEAFTAVARVVAVERDSMELVYIGTPQAAFGGTTWKEKFGAPKNGNEGFTF
jgi:hypothetical protein